MARWIIYIRERFPLPVYITLIAGFVVSGAFLAQASVSFTQVLSAGGMLLLFFAELRLMDEFKDYKKDLIAHPLRPLPRGVLSLKEVKSAILTIILIMIALSGAIGAVFGTSVGGLALLFTLYLWVMYKEFYIGEKLGNHPLIYALSHQIIVIPICLFTIAVFSKEQAFDNQAFAYSFSVLGAFFGYEVCRKLDPSSHPVLKTYLSVYGPVRTLLIVSILISVAATASYYLESRWILWLVEGVFASSLILIVIRPVKFRWVEALATLSLVFHIWSGPLNLLSK